jgi:hypothetical protein
VTRLVDRQRRVVPSHVVNSNCHNQTVTGLVVVLVGLAVFLGIAALLLLRFRRINGVRVDGLVSQIVLAAGASDSLIYLGAFAAGVLVAFASLWWLVAAAAVAGGIGCAFGARDHVAAVRRMIDILE